MANKNVNFNRVLYHNPEELENERKTKQHWQTSHEQAEQFKEKSPDEQLVWKTWEVRTKNGKREENKFEVNLSK